MSRASPYIGNFENGEISPRAQGRKDEDQYRKSVKTSYNGVPTLQGAWTRRGGSHAVVNTKNNAYTKIIPFIISRSQAYLLEFGNNYVRFYSNRGPVYSSGTTPFELTSPYATADLPFIKFAQYQKTLYLATPNEQPYQLVFTSNLVWALTAVAFQDGPYLKSYYRPGIDGPLIGAIDAAFTTSPSTNLTGTAFGVVSILISNVASVGGQAQIIFAPGQLEYLIEGDTVNVSGMVSPLAGLNGNWKVHLPTPTAAILVGSTYSGGTVVPANPAFVVDVTWVGKNIAVGPVSTWRFALASSPTYFLNGVVNAIGNGGPSGLPFDFSVTTNRTGLSSSVQLVLYATPAWGTFATGTIYPSSVVFHENRMWFGSSNSPFVVGSFVANYTRMSPSDYAANSITDNTVITDSCAVSYQMVAEQSYVVYWQSSDEKGLIVGTSGGPWIVRPNTLNEAITPTNITAKRVTTYPAQNLPQVTVGKSAIYVESSGRRVREVTYFFDIDGFRAIDLSEWSEHITSPGVTTELVYQNVPQPIIWGARSDGTLFSSTYDRTLDRLRNGWSQHNLGGVSDNIGTPPIVESLAVIPSPDGTYDDVWVSVVRYVNGTQFRSIEYLNKIFESFDLPEDAFHLDYGSTIDNPVAVQNMTAGTTTSVQSNSHGLSAGDYLRFAYVNGLATSAGQPSALNGILTKVLTIIDANNYTIDFNSAALTAFIISPAVALGLPTATVSRKLVTAVSGLSRLNGETVRVLGDGADLGSFTVVSGAITLPGLGAGKIQVGYGFKSILRLLRFEAGGADGTSFGKFRKINELAFLVDRSGIFEYGTSFDQLNTVDYRRVPDSVNMAVPLFSGMAYNQNAGDDWGTDNEIIIQQTTPLPLTILAVMPQQTTEDKG